MKSSQQKRVSVRPLAPWQRALASLFGKAWVELSIGILIVLSVVLTLAEFTLSAATQSPAISAALNAIQWSNHLLTCVFVVELALRYLAFLSLRRFLREYWIDLVAVLPSLIPGLYTVKLMRLIRLLRILRLFGFLSRFSSNFPYILRRGAVEYVTVCGLLVFTVMLGAGAMVLFEGKLSGGGGMSFQEAFWFSVYSLFAGEPIPEAPRTVGGRLVAVGVMFMGLTIFAMFTGTVSAFMVERLRNKERFVDWDSLHDHVIICGWNGKAEIIVEEFQASHTDNETPIVVVAQWDGERPTLPPAVSARVRFLDDDFTRVTVLEKAGIHRARICVILADTTGGRTEQDADARTILAALTAEKLNSGIYTCAELHNRDYGSHLEMGHVNDYVVSSEYSAYLLAQGALNRGLMGVFNELLTYKRGNQFYRIALPPQWSGREFAELFVEAKQRFNAILVAVHRSDGRIVLNPSSYTFEPGDEIVAIAETAFLLD